MTGEAFRGQQEALAAEAVICPVCRQPVGQVCLTRDDRIMVEPHVRRVRAAAKAAG